MLALRKSWWESWLLEKQSRRVSVAAAALCAACASERFIPAERFTSPSPRSVPEVESEASEIRGLLSLVAKQDGRVVIEKYFEGTESDELHHLRSATKSVTGLLVGIAIDQGLIDSVDVTLGEVLGGQVDRFGTAKAALTLEHLLTMSAGLEWNESTVDEYNNWRVSRDPLAHYLERPFVAAPGDVWAYSSGASHLLSVVLGAVTNGTAAQYAQDVLFGPLGITDYRWETVASGDTNGAAGLELTSSDALKLGELLLGRGVWSGRRIVSEKWIAVSTRDHHEVGADMRYGYQWWVVENAAGPVWAALGFAGQVIAVLPEHDTVIVANSRWKNRGRPAAEQSTEIQRFLSDRLVPFLVPEYGS